MKVETVSREKTCGDVETVEPVERTRTILKSTAAGSAKLQLAIKTSHFEGVVDAGAKSQFHNADPKTKKIGPNTNKTDAYQNSPILLSSSSSLSSATTSQNKKQTQFDFIRSQSRIVSTSTTSNSNLNLLNESTSTSCASSNAENSYEISFDESRGQGAISSISTDLPLIISSSKPEDNLDFPVAQVCENDTENKIPDCNGAVPSVSCLPRQTHQIDLDLIELGHANTKASETINIEQKGPTDSDSNSAETGSSTSNSANKFGIPDAKTQQGLLAGLITTAGKKNTVNIYVTQCFNCQGECVRQRISVVSEQPLKINPEILKSNEAMVSGPRLNNKQRQLEKIATTSSPLGSSVSSILNNSDSTQDKLDANADIRSTRITSLLDGPEPETELESYHRDNQFSTTTTATVAVTRQQPEQPNLIPDDNKLHISSPNPTNVRKRQRRRHRPLINKKRRVGVKKHPNPNQNQMKLKSKYTPAPAPLTLASPTSSLSVAQDSEGLFSSATATSLFAPGSDVAVASTSCQSTLTLTNGLHQGQGDYTGMTTTTDSNACRNFEVGKPTNYKDIFWTATSDDKTSMIYQCKKCDFNGSSNKISETKLKEHFQKHYQPNRFICQNSLCKKSYETPSGLKRHYTSTAHNVNIVATTALRKSKKAKI